MSGRKWLFQRHVAMGRAALKTNIVIILFFALFVLCGGGIEVSRKPILLQNPVSRREFLPPPTAGVDSGSRGVPLSYLHPPELISHQ